MSTAAPRSSHAFTLPIGLALFFGFALVACPAPPEGEPNVTPEVQEDTALVRAQQEATDACQGLDPCVIVITLGEENGTLQYQVEETGEDARVVRVATGQVVEWQAAAGLRWAVEFARGRSPLPAARYGTRGGLQRGGPVVADSGVFKYFVAVVRQGEPYTDDPEFVVH